MQPSFNFINIEYIFNRVYDCLLWIEYIYLFKIKGMSESEYAAQYCHTSSYDGLCERFGIGSGGPFGANSHLVDSGVNSFFAKIAGLFGGGGNGALVSTGVDTTLSTPLDSAFLALIHFVRDLITLTALILLGIYVYAKLGWKDAAQKYEKKFEDAFIPPVESEVKNTRWSIISAHMESGNPSEWRLAILEADNMLFELLQTLPYEGTTVGEKLTNANTANFKTHSDAWEAHKVRNKIAHDGAAFELSEREAQRIIALYRNVFEEFNFGIS